MTSRNYYEVLGLAAFADGGMVDQAYWHLAKTYQTLAVSDPRARRLLDELNEAYGVLGTPRLREEYDQELAGRSPQGRSKKKIGRPASSRSRSGPRLPITLPSFGPFGGGRKDSERQRVEPTSVLTEAPTPADTTPIVPSRSHKADVGDLRASTARMLERWRTNAGIQTAADQEERQPDRTLVDIFKSERELESHDDPLTAVIEILRAPRQVITAKTDG